MTATFSKTVTGIDHTMSMTALTKFWDSPFAIAVICFVFAIVVWAFPIGMWMFASKSSSFVVLRICHDGTPIVRYADGTIRIRRTAFLNWQIDGEWQEVCGI